MSRFGVALVLIAHALIATGCSSESPSTLPDQFGPSSKDDGEPKTTKKAETAEPSAPPAGDEPTPADPSPPPPEAPDAGGASCALGDGLYCGGNGVPGSPNELFRCTGGVPALETICAGECARMPDGYNDICACALGNGLYCAGNGVNGTAGNLYRCTDGTVTLETTCGGGCENRPAGENDRCF